MTHKIFHCLGCLCVTLMVFSSPLSGEMLSEEEKQDLFSQAKTFFRQGNEMSAQDAKAAQELYRKAVMRFERIVEQGEIQNGKLYYNIGNAYFLMGNLGQAILNYRRAEQYIPNDPNLRQNLNYALSKRQDKIEEKAQTQVLKTLLFWHYDLSSEMRSLLFIAGFILLWTGLSIRLFYKRVMPRWILGFLGLFTVLFLTSLLTDVVLESRNKRGVILANEVIARKGDGNNYQHSFKEPLHAGTEFQLIENRNEWYQIELLDGRSCWVPSAKAALLSGSL